MFIDNNSPLKHFLNVTVPKAFFFQWRRSAMLNFLNPEDMKGTTFRFLFHAFDWQRGRFLSGIFSYMSQPPP